MASLQEYFIKDGASNLTTHQTWNVARANGSPIGEVTARLHLDFDAHAKYISFYIPALEDGDVPVTALVGKISEVLEWPKTMVGVQAGHGEEKKDATTLVFTGQVYIYSEQPVPEAQIAALTTEALGLDLNLTFRSETYMRDRNKWEKALAFISHDRRDKAGIAQPLALQLQKFMCPVWYDEFSLRAGDSLRESIEKGLKECPKCVFILTPNFLKNGGWSKREYDSIFTREIVEQRKVILPVWDGVTAKDVYEYSPILADRVAIPWSLGVEEVARRLLLTINASSA